MSAKKNDDNLFGDGGDLSQDLIDQMLNGGDLGSPAPEVDPWSDDALQAEIDAARVAAGVMEAPSSVATMAPPAPMPTPISAAPSASQAKPTAVHPVQFMPLSPEPPTNERAHGIEMLMDVALEVSVELGRSHMSIGEILGLRTGSVIELDKLAGEPVDVSVNGTLIARGEVVVVDEKFGVRITEVVSKARRIASLG
ncbi:MAG TPA: flagellar motor switch protein FliN [Chloroflexota bacterium]|jgi:flagellar motor switch protein FliN/FliY